MKNNNGKEKVILTDLKIYTKAEEIKTMQRLPYGQRWLEQILKLTSFMYYWGSIADQLRKKDLFTNYTENLANFLGKVKQNKNFLRS